MPSRRRSPSSTYAPPSGTEEANSQPVLVVAARAAPGSSSRDSEVTSRRMPSRSSSSSRPKCAAFPGESGEYRAARDRLLEQEIELRRAIEAVAAARRRLPPRRGVAEGYLFHSPGAGGDPA